MKKILAMLLAVAMMLSLVACGSGDKPSSGDGDSSSSGSRSRQLTRKTAGPRLTVFLQREPESSPRGGV